MVTISPELQVKIERRARRAWRRRAEGDQKRSFHRISDLQDKELLYRVPYTPDYYGKEKIRVVMRDDGSVLVDPPTTGLIDVLTKDDLVRLKKHEGAVRAYMLVKAGTTYKFPVTYRTNPDPHPPLKSRAQCIDTIKVGDHVYVVEAEWDDLTLGTSDFTAREFEITGELDPVKDLGFTTGLLDCLIKTDVEGLRKKKHLGRVRAYKYTDKDGRSPYQSPKITYVVGKHYEIKDADTDPASNCHKGVNVADFAWAKRSARSDQRMFAFEFEMDDIAAIPTNTDGKFRVHRCDCVEEIDTKTWQPIKNVKALPEPRSPQDDLDELTAPVDETTETTETPKKQGFFGKLFGKKDDGAEQSS